jgi:hypothetical protein
MEWYDEPIMSEEQCEKGVLAFRKLNLESDLKNNPRKSLVEEAFDLGYSDKEITLLLYGGLPRMTRRFEEKAVQAGRQAAFPCLYLQRKKTFPWLHFHKETEYPRLPSYYRHSASQYRASLQALASSSLEEALILMP